MGNQVDRAQLRGKRTLSDTMHVVLGGVTVFLMFLAIGFGASAFGKRFRAYSIVSVVILLTFGALTFLEAPRLETNLPTPWIGLWERINISAFLLWIVVLAIALLRAGPSGADRLHGGSHGSMHERMGHMHQQMMGVATTHAESSRATPQTSPMD